MFFSILCVTSVKSRGRMKWYKFHLFLVQYNCCRREQPYMLKGFFCHEGYYLRFYMHKQFRALCKLLEYYIEYFEF